jgi:FkbM family methyltransferase
MRLTVSFYNLPDRTIAFGYRGHDVRLFVPDADHDALQFEILKHRTFFEERILRDIRERVDMRGGVVIDAGANIGNHTVYFSRVCGAPKVLAFEPNPRAAAILARNIEINDLRGIEIRKEALSDTTGTVSFDAVDPHNLGGTSFKKGGADNIPALAIDALALDRLAFIKCDVEGASELVLRGAVKTLGRLRPPILIEIQRQETGVRPILADLGYRQTVAYDSSNFLFTADLGITHS